MSEQAQIARVKLFGMNFVSAPNYDEILNEIGTGIQCSDEQLPLMITPNVDQVVKFHRKKNSRLFGTLQQAYYVLPDGQPLVTISKWKKSMLQKRLTGSDFFPQVWELLKAQNTKVAFILSDEKIASALRAEYHNIDTYVPPFFDHENEAEFSAVCNACEVMITRSRAKHLFIGLGFPKQEKVFLELYERMVANDRQMPFTYLLGASMEFYTGTRKRAPKIYQKLGIEFLHRLITEPRRMAKRYLIDDLAIVPLAWRELRNRNPG